MTTKSVVNSPCLFDGLNPCRSLKGFRKLCKSETPVCKHLRKFILGDIELFAMMDSQCYGTEPYCVKPESSQLRMIARWETPLSRQNYKYKKLTFELESLEADAIAFKGDDSEIKPSTVTSGTLYVFPDYGKVDKPDCNTKSFDVVKKSESALHHVPVVVNAQVWKDDLTLGDKSQEFIMQVAVPPLDQQPSVLTAPAPLEVFISYAHEDLPIKERLVKYLKSLKNNGVVGFWTDREISPGTEWFKEIVKHLDSAQIILLLISLDFLGSTFIDSVELSRALQRHAAGEARVIPIIVRECDWENYEIAKLQALPPAGKWIAKENEDNWFTEVKNGLREVIKEFEAARVS